MVEGTVIFAGSWAVTSLSAGLGTAINPAEMPPEFTRRLIIPVAGPFVVLTDRRFRLDNREIGLLVAYSVAQVVGAAFLVAGAAVLGTENRRARRRRWSLYPAPGGGGFSVRF